MTPPHPTTSSPTLHGGRATVAEPVFVGKSAAMRTALDQARRLAPHEHAAVLIEGESGTGKSYLARLLHLRSPRAAGPFHHVILSTLDDNLASSDLFGHLSGSYTDARQSRPGHFVTANGGTLFLDEIGKASFAVQRKLLHAVEHNEVWPVGADRSVRLNVRLVTASNVSLQELAARGDFLPDLAARLTGFRVRLPALRERREDIPGLVEQFIAIRAPRYGYAGVPPTVSAPLMRVLAAADWPNNLRQLDGAVQRLLMEAEGEETLLVEHCQPDFDFLNRDSFRESPIKTVITPEVVQERLDVMQSVTATARSLGVSRWTVYRYLERARPAS